MPRDKYATISVTVDLKRRLAAIAARNKRSAPKQLEHWCDLEEQRALVTTSDVEKHTPELQQ